MIHPVQMLVSSEGNPRRGYHLFVYRVPAQGNTPNEVQEAKDYLHEYMKAIEPRFQFTYWHGLNSVPFVHWRASAGYDSGD